MREGIRFSYEVLTKGDAFKDIVVDEYPWEMPLHSDEEMKRAVLDRCQTAFHPCGTNRCPRQLARVWLTPSSRFTVSRTSASIIPVVPDCYIQNSVYMVGEKGADLIKADHNDLFK